MNAPAHILAVKMSSLGDLFHARPAVWHLARGLGARVDWVTQTPYAELVGHFPGVDRVIPFPRHAFLRDGPAFLRSLRRTPYDLAADFQGLLKSALVTRAARASRRIICSFAREGSRCLFREIAGPTDKNRHAVEECLDTVRYLNLPVEGEPPPVRFPSCEISGPRPYIGCVTASRWPAKDWPAEYAGEAVRALLSAVGGTVILLGGGAERAVCERIADASGDRVRNTAGRTSLVEMAGILQAMDLVISVDSGPLHIAAAAGTPVLGLYGLTDPKRTGPYGPGHRVLTPEGRKPRPRDFKRTDEEALRYMREIRPDRVVEEAMDMLGARA